MFFCIDRIKKPLEGPIPDHAGLRIMSMYINIDDKSIETLRERKLKKPITDPKFNTKTIILHYV